MPDIKEMDLIKLMDNLVVVQFEVDNLEVIG